MRRLLIVGAAAGTAVVLGVALVIGRRYVRRWLDRIVGRAARPEPGATGARRATEQAGRVAPRLTTAPTRVRPSPLMAAPRFSGLALVVLPALTLAGGVFFLTVGAPWLLSRQHFPAPPEQPVYFSHEVHVQQAGLDCAFCHRTADRVSTAGFPDVQQCLFCHIVVDDLQRATQQTAYAGQIEKLRAAWVEGEPIEWARIHRLPDHSRFPHDAHVLAGVACATCHGEVERRDVVQQTRSLKMADCVACHQETQAPTDCVDCHH